jgi:ribonuclease P/MRP protein subunit RPP1
LSTPFRQYTRLTVCVENPLQANALNAGNPILKTYDLVAVKPLNQTVFDIACERMAVSLILSLIHYLQENTLRILVYVK